MSFEPGSLSSVVQVPGARGPHWKRPLPSHRLLLQHVVYCRNKEPISAPHPSRVVPPLARHPWHSDLMGHPAAQASLICRTWPPPSLWGHGVHTAPATGPLPPSCCLLPVPWSLPAAPVWTLPAAPLMPPVPGGLWCSLWH